MLKFIIICGCFILSAWLVYTELPKQALVMRFTMPNQALPQVETDSNRTSFHKTAKQQESSFYRHQYIPRIPTISVHSATAEVLPDGRLISCWYGGTREGHKDVSIFCAYYQNHQWSAPQIAMTRQYTTQSVKSYTKKLGNPVLYYSSKTQELWLFYVSVSIGGWSASAINFSISQDMGLSWSAPKRLISSPFLNLSTLVKSPPIQLSNGNLALPVYHESLTKFSELLVISTGKQQVVYKSRISHRNSGIQPYVFVSDAHKGVALLRNTTENKNTYILSSLTKDGGLTWQPITRTRLVNPNAAISGIRIHDTHDTARADLPWLLVFNDHPTTRQDLSLAASTDGKDWQPIYTFAENNREDFAYPWILEDHQGIFHLLFTYNRERIDHIRFNKTWLLEQLDQQTKRETKPTNRP